MNSNAKPIKGFKAWAVKAGLKKGNGLDLALIFSEKAAVAAGLFTTNKVKAAPVLLTQKHIRNHVARAIIANSGNANACSGKRGLDDAGRMAVLTAEALGIAPDEVLVASTGVIGRPLDMDLVSGAIPELVRGLSIEGMPLAAEAIMTTDSFPKLSFFEGRAAGRTYRIMGIAKGAGMIMPNMATMLAFVISDIEIDAGHLEEALLFSVESTFNRITVDGDTSTNDTVLALANGMTGNGPLSKEEYRAFSKGLESVMSDLSHMIVKDGEGATKVVHVEICGAHSASDALVAAKTVANSPLVKTAFYGQDPNWGRIMAALGRAGIEMIEERVDIWIDDILIVEKGLGKGVANEERASQNMALGEFRLVIDLNMGGFRDKVVTCDLTHEYVSINADYRT
ncbi:MAG: bifunctional glutamate N-acetyltransferase/amino-acid acetyltransferase ArgJ [Desulfatiglans sp.]|jgi:glutamate N-acetyltransferase/amino-acid N-acetyltransferase|nr:bifunctional glutamate N-acetyltransferase/amino-acid acetyltransferase ArgJ [Desulfatiglans sp.]